MKKFENLKSWKVTKSKSWKTWKSWIPIKLKTFENLNFWKVEKIRKSRKFTKFEKFETFENPKSWEKLKKLENQKVSKSGKVWWLHACFTLSQWTTWKWRETQMIHFYECVTPFLTSERRVSEVAKLLPHFANVFCFLRNYLALSTLQIFWVFTNIKQYRCGV